jgi:hypothetical protein
MGRLLPPGLGSSLSYLALRYGFKPFLVMPPPLAAPLIMLDECLLTVDLTERPQLNRSRFSPLHVHGFTELELYR